MKNKEEKPEMPPVSLTDNLLDNLVELRALFGGSADLTIRRMTVCSREIALVTVEGMVDRHLMADAVILPMARMTGESASAETLISRIRDEVLGFVDMQQVTTFGELANLITSGFAAVLVEGVPYAVLGGLQGFMIRGISEPSTEVTVRAPARGSTEAIRVIFDGAPPAQVPGRLPLRCLPPAKPPRRPSACAICRTGYPGRLLDDIRARIQDCPLEAVLESGYIQPFLENKRRSLFTSVEATERPDTLCGKVLEGRIGVLVDGTPFVLVVPTLFVEHFQSMDDYTQHPVYASFIRIIKYVSFFISLFLPGLYVAIGTHHPEMFPPVLLMTFLNSEHATRSL